MPGKKRTTEQRLADEEQVAKLMLENPDLSQSEIADRLSISQPTVSRHKMSLYQRWVENAAEYHSQMMVMFLQRSQWRYDQAQEAWLASKEPLKERKTEGGRAEPSKASIRTVDRDGSGEFLRIMRDEDAYQAKMLGLLRDKVDVTSNGRTLGISADLLAKADEKAEAELEAWMAGRFGDDAVVQ